ncbi:MAG: hypothetical protein GY778_20200 [bacterium]|nr:hypothetical protein [bacterium]
MTTNDRRPARLPNGTQVHVCSKHFAEECDAVVVDATYDDGWLYRLDVTAGDRLDGHRNDDGKLWVCDFEVQTIEAPQA